MRTREPPKAASARSFESPAALNELDEKILRALESNARLSFAEVGEAVGLSKTPTWSRVRDLERRRVISGYRAEIEPAAIGLAIHAFVQVTIKSTQAAEFEQAVVGHRTILECYTIAGQADYLLHVLVADVAALDSLLRGQLSRMPGVERLTTTVGLKTIKRRGSIMECGRGAA